MKQEFVILATVGSIILLTIVVAYLTNRFFARMIRKSSEELDNDPTTYKFLKRASVAIIYLLGTSIAIYSVPSLRTLASSILAGAGILAVAVGFASQQALSNIISGIFVVLFKPFRVNDRISVKGMTGIVEDITLRHTVIRDFENRRIVVPNAIISDEVIVNASMFDDRSCKWIDMGISYDSDVIRAKEIMVQEIENHSLHIDPRTPEQLEEGIPKVMVRLVSLGDSSVNLRAWAWAKDTPDGFVLQCDLLERIKVRFEAEGIQIPFPHRTVILKDNRLEAT